MFGELKKRVEDLCLDKSSNAIRNLEVTIKDHEMYMNKKNIIMQSMSKDANTVKKLVSGCLSCQLSASLCPHDVVSALDPMHDVHEKNHLPKIQGCDAAVAKLLDNCKIKKNEMNIFVHHFMQKVASLHMFSLSSEIFDYNFQLLRRQWNDMMISPHI